MEMLVAFKMLIEESKVQEGNEVINSKINSTPMQRTQPFKV